MKKWAAILIAIFLTATLQASWPGFLNFFYCKPDLLLVLSLALVLFLNFKAAFLVAALAGLIKDSFLPQEQGSLAINSVLFALWGYFCYRLNRQVSTENDYVRLGVVLIVAFLNNIILGLYEISSSVIPAGIFLRSLIITPVYTALVSPLFFKLSKKITQL